MELIATSNYRRFPPRLPEQPIFYPVTNLDYAESIAKSWNAPDEKCGFVGFITAFILPEDYLSQFPVKQVGAANCTELWVPAEDLEEFNSKIVNGIRVIGAFYGEKYQGVRPRFEF